MLYPTELRGHLSNTRTILTDRFQVGNLAAGGGALNRDSIQFLLDATRPRSVGGEGAQSDRIDTDDRRVIAKARGGDKSSRCLCASLF